MKKLMRISAPIMMAALAIGSTTDAYGQQKEFYNFKMKETPVAIPD